MTSNVELLPLYAELQGHPKLEIIKHYARAVAEHNVKKRDAEIEALRAEVARRTERVIVHRGQALACSESVHAAYTDEHHRAERLAEALHKLEDSCEDSDGVQYGTLATSFVRGICKDALRDHDQEMSNG